MQPRKAYCEDVYSGDHIAISPESIPTKPNETSEMKQCFTLIFGLSEVQLSYFLCVYEMCIHVIQMQ